MPPLQLLVLALSTLVALATLRLVRVHLGRTPLPEGRGRRIFFLAFVVVPPIALGALTLPASALGMLRGISAVPIYAVLVVILVILMAIAALVIGQVAYGPGARLVRLALTGSQDDLRDHRPDPPMTARLAEGVLIVDQANSAFPRGPDFPAQVGRVGFRADWDALDGATRQLEGHIADDNRLDLGVASKAQATASDARGRLDMLRRLALEQGQTWPASPATV
jgi:hypothetical protein